MRTVRTRLPKNFSLERYFDSYAQAIECDPWHLAGSWKSWHGVASNSTPWKEVRLDLGCGKGPFTVACAQANPEVLFVGLDLEAVCIAYAARRAVEAQVPNVVFVVSDGLGLADIFAPGELSCIYLNYPTPFHRTKHAPRRLTYLDRLLTYANLLAKDGTLRFQSDSQPLRDFTLTQLHLAGYTLLENLDDARKTYPDDPWTEYEQRTTAMGATKHLVVAKPGSVPASIQQTAALGLIHYLPENLNDMKYVPVGMEVTVRNLKIARAKGKNLG